MERLLDIGCGPSKHPGYVGIDQQPFPGVDIVRDLRRGLPFDDSSVDGIYSAHVLEHFQGNDLLFLVEEFYRVSKPDIEWTIIVPDATSPNRYRDPTHATRDWYEDSFIFWQVDQGGKHVIFAGPIYNRKAKIELLGTATNSNKDRLYRLKALK